LWGVNITGQGGSVSPEYPNAKESVDNHKFEEFTSIETNFVEMAKRFGASIEEIKTSIDWKDLQYNEGRLCLHEEKIPFRLKGKGTKRLLSIALQLTLIENSGIILIDEVEQGLEPDRVRQLVSILKKESNAQVIMTTHSSNAVVELNSNNLYRINDNTLYNFPDDNDNQSLARTNPEAFFAKRLIVVEGATEVGLMRAVNEQLMIQGSNCSSKSIGIVDGKGSSMIKYCNALLDAGYEVCLLCDNDRPEDQKNKKKIQERGALIIQSEDNLCIEQQIFKDLSWEAVIKLYEFGKRNSKFLNSIDNLKEEDTSIRTTLGLLASGKELSKNLDDTKKGKEPKGWFKNVSHGEELGTIIFEDRNNFLAKHMGNMIAQLHKWINNE